MLYGPLVDSCWCPALHQRTTRNQQRRAHGHSRLPLLSPGQGDRFILSLLICCVGPLKEVFLPTRERPVKWALLLVLDAACVHNPCVFQDARIHYQLSRRNKTPGGSLMDTHSILVTFLSTIKKMCNSFFSTYSQLII